jgi:hypothetical protein
MLWAWLEKYPIWNSTLSNGTMTAVLVSSNVFRIFPFNSLTSINLLSTSSQSQSQSYITTDSQFWCQAPNWDGDQFFPIFFLLFFRQFWVCWVEHPLWREVGSVLSSFCLTSPDQPFSDLSRTELMSIFYCLYFWDSPNLEGPVPVFISPRNRVAQFPRALVLSG